MIICAPVSYTQLHKLRQQLPVRAGLLLKGVEQALDAGRNKQVLLLQAQQTTVLAGVVYGDNASMDCCIVNRDTLLEIIDHYQLSLIHIYQGNTLPRHDGIKRERFKAKANG